METFSRVPGRFAIPGGAAAQTLEQGLGDLTVALFFCADGAVTAIAAWSSQ
jgi:hypothetical protein